MANGQSNPPPGITLDPQPVGGPPPGITLDKSPVGATPTPPAPAAGTDLPWMRGTAQGGGNVTGLVKSGVATAAGLANLVNKYAQADLGEDPVPTFSDITRRALEWSKPRTDQERQGFVVGNVGQLLLAPELAPELGLSDLVEGIPYADRVLETAKTLKTMGGETIPGRLMRIGASVLTDAAKAAPRAAAEVGGQTYVQTGDPEAARQAAISAAKWGGALGAAGGAVSGTRQEAAALAQSLRPGTRTLAGVPFETVPRTQDLMLRNLGQVPGGDPATQAVDLALGHVGRTAVKNSIQAVNDARAPVAEIIPPSRQLPGRAGLTVPGTPLTEEITQPSQEGRRVYDVTRETPEGTAWQTPLNYQDFPPPTGGGSVVRSQGGPMILSEGGQGIGVNRARQQIAQYDRILSDPAQTSEMGARQLQDLQAAHADLSEQVRRFDDFAASQPHFPMHDIPAAQAATDSLGDAGTQLKGIAGQMWTKADQAARDAGDTETFSGLRAEAKNINKRLYNGSANYDDLRAQLADNQQRMSAFFDRYRTQFSPREATSYIRMYQDGAVVDSLDALIQGQFRRGITRADEAAGVGRRVFQPSEEFGKQLENFYSDNRAVLERTIGTDHMNDLKTMTSELFQDASRREATQGLMKSIGSAIRRHSVGLRAVLGGTAGGGLGAYAEYMGAHFAGHAMALPLAGMIGGGTLAAGLGGTISGTQRYIVDNLATNPKFMQQFVYAVQHEVPPRVAGPILAARIIGASQQPQGRVSAPPTTTTPTAIPRAATEPQAPAPPAQGTPPPREDARPGPYVTPLTGRQEAQFEQWVRDSNIPFRDGPNNDYDMRGYFLDHVLHGEGQGTAVSQYDQRTHFPDTYKTPYHHSFSNESKYALPSAPHWDGDRLIDRSGNVVVDETPRSGGR